MELSDCALASPLHNQIDELVFPPIARIRCHVFTAQGTALWNPQSLKKQDRYPSIEAFTQALLGRSASGISGPELDGPDEPTNPSGPPEFLGSIVRGVCQVCVNKRGEVLSAKRDPALLALTKKS